MTHSSRNPAQVVALVDGITGTVLDAAGLEQLLALPAGALTGRDVFDLGDEISIRRLLAALGVLFDHPGGTRAVTLRSEHGDGGWVEIPLLVWNAGDDVATPRIALAHAASAADDGAPMPEPDVDGRDELLRHLSSSLPPDGGGVVVTVQLDELDTIGAALGAPARSEVLHQVLDRILDNCEAHQRVATIGFATIALADCEATRDDAYGRGRLLHDLLSLPFQLDDNELFLAPRVAVAHRSTPVGAEGLLLSAVGALDHRRVTSRVVVVDAEDGETARERLTLHSQLRRSIENGELVVHYQPLVDLRTTHITGAEALLRWQHPGLGLLAPDLFIPLAEQSDFILPMGAWVLREACQQAEVWLRQFPWLGDFVMSVNVSPHQITDESFVETVDDALAFSGIAARHLCLEITESAVLDPDAFTQETFRRLVGLGVTLAVDDFGTGHASLDHLRTIPAGVIKIDRSFVDGLPDQIDETVLVTGTIDITHALGRVAVAEGVESEFQLERLASLDCDQAQGYLISRPVPPEDFAELLRARQHSR